ncbi:MAG: hypothetical protein LBQ34_02295 [Alphaproteobacteria bacterium]|jgi:hypothetical protein|nr:hypothetical protein [Alphaproteobacteria bacterium]
MKKIFFITILAIFSFSLNAAEYRSNQTYSRTPAVQQYSSTPANQDAKLYYNHNINKNSIIIGGGMANNTVKLNNEKVDGLESIYNINLAYLRKISDSSFSLGLDFNTFLNNNNTTTATYNAYTMLLLADYEFFRSKYFGLALQLGGGAALQNLDYKTDYFSVNSSTITPSAKIGLVGNIYISESFALGLGVHYIYMNETKIDMENNKTITMANTCITLNASLKFMF